ncbi:trypsin-like serine protease [Hyalangium sp.]|uniref:trypsin-like serine protease n=1 Tax=Hyalangium sp. TaxID=2028555 RepID=UPI002D6900B1|nr:trypsin-like serine protease [Hyalangium sp.]HYH96089.1 trypsin-like serine protease [Hyalangium sp.]
MRHHQRLFIQILSSAALLSVLGGCFARTSVEGPPAPRRLTVGPGKPDVANRHLSSVMIKASVEQRDRSICSGVLISPSLVLTAGHCVCKNGRRVQGPNGEERLVFNGSSCQQRVIVKTYVYNPEQENLDKINDPDDYDALTRHYTGRVQPHPRFEVTLIGSGSAAAGTERRLDDYYVESVRADLALVFLTKDVDAKIPIAELPDDEVPVGTRVELVGYGVGYGQQKPGEQMIELRRVGDNKVKDKKELVQSEALKGVLADAEKIVFDRTGALALGGDSGGPCLQMKRNAKGAVVFSLVGIASWSTANESIFTSVYQHREWLGERKRCSRNEACRSRVIEQSETH